MRMPDSSNMQTFSPPVTLQRCWFGSVGRVVDGGTVVVVGETVVVDLAVDDFILTTILEALILE